MPPEATVKPYLDIAPSGANTILLQTEDGGEFELPKVRVEGAMQWMLPRFN